MKNNLRSILCICLVTVLLVSTLASCDLGGKNDETSAMATTTAAPTFGEPDEGDTTTTAPAFGEPDGGGHYCNCARLRGTG